MLPSSEEHHLNHCTLPCTTGAIEEHANWTCCAGTSIACRSSASVQGLGLAPDGKAVPMAAGFVGQEEAREAAGIVVDMIRSKKMAGRALLMTGAGTPQASPLAFAPGASAACITCDLPLRSMSSEVRRWGRAASQYAPI